MFFSLSLSKKKLCCCLWNNVISDILVLEIYVMLHDFFLNVMKTWCSYFEGFMII